MFHVCFTCNDVNAMPITYQPETIPIPNMRWCMLSAYDAPSNPAAVTIPPKITGGLGPNAWHMPDEKGPMK